MNKFFLALIMPMLSALAAQGQLFTSPGSYRVYRIKVEYSNVNTFRTTPLEDGQVRMLLTTDYGIARLYKTDKSAAQLKTVGGPVYQLDRVKLINHTYKEGVLTEFHKAIYKGVLTPPDNAIINPSTITVSWVVLPDNSYKMVLNYFVKPKTKTAKHLLASYYEYTLYCLQSK